MPADLIDGSTIAIVDTDSDLTAYGVCFGLAARVSIPADFGTEHKVVGNHFPEIDYQGASGNDRDDYGYSYCPPQNIYAWNWFSFFSGSPIRLLRPLHGEWQILCQAQGKLVAWSENEKATTVIMHSRLDYSSQT